MSDREMTIEGVKAHIDPDMSCEDCPYWTYRPDCFSTLWRDVAELLKEQNGYVTVPFSWLVKFCTHIDFKEPVTDEERELLWKQKLKQQFGIELEGES